MTLALLAFIAGVMVGALAGAFVVSLAVAARRGDDMRTFKPKTRRSVDGWSGLVIDRDTSGEFFTDATWEEHA